MRFGWDGFVRLILALTILFSVFSRPPGTMLVLESEQLVYVICTGGEPETISVALDGGEGSGDEIDLECDFFASQIAAFLFAAPDFAPEAIAAGSFGPVPAPQLATSKQVSLPYAPRAPPFVS